MCGRELEVLLALARCGGSARVAEVKESLRAAKSRVPGAAVAQLLRRLLHKGLVENPSRSQYLIPDPMFRVYVGLRDEAQ